MRQSALWGIVLTLAGAGSLRAQGLTMQMSNGWAFTFSGNVNAFAVYTDGKLDKAGGSAGAISGGLVPAEKVTRIRTGLLPGFANFEARGKEGPLDLKVHFGFAPQIQSPGVHDNFGNGTQAGAQIDMREVYLTVGGPWGQILAGRELDLFQRQNILTDMTLFGVGASGGGFPAGGTTLGRIGFGYIYPNFNAQITYSTPAGKPLQLSVGAFDPSAICTGGCTNPAKVTLSGIRTPRVEAEVTWTSNVGGGGGGAAAPTNKVMLFASGMFQNTFTSITPVSGDTSISVGGAAGGIKLDLAGLSLVGSGYWGKGMGTTLLFSDALDAAGQKRESWGYIGQASYSPHASKWTLGASYGLSRLVSTPNDGPLSVSPLVKYNVAGDGMLTYQWTKSLRWVLEYTWARSRAFSGAQTTSNQGATGLMLFF